MTVCTPPHLLRLLSASLYVQVRATPASASNPGIPPCSLMSLLRAKPSIAGVVLADFDSAYINRRVASCCYLFTVRLLQGTLQLTIL